MTTPRTLPAADIVAMDAVLTDLHAAVEGVLADTFDFHWFRASLVRSRHKYMIAKRPEKSK